jgi:superfamily I DNA/RNA helicase
MKTPVKISKIAGPPGTGKTTYLLSLVAAAVKKYDPERIGAVSYTNAAVETIKGRIGKAINASADVAMNVKTLHSHCFKLLELKKDMIADTPKRIKQWNEENPSRELPTGQTDKREDEPSIDQKMIGAYAYDNQKTFQEMNLLRNRMIPADQWPVQVRQFHEAWAWWMEINGYVDFTGMLEEVLEKDLIPDIDILFCDESQDLSRLQMAILHKWSERVTSTLFVGDSDQAIFRWNGASPEEFINLDHGWFKPLEQSYRVPKAVHEYAMSIITQANDREDVPYAPTEVEGQVIHGVSMPDFRLSGTHMIIGRCNFHLNRWKNLLINEGIPWHNPYRPKATAWNPTNTKSWKAMQTYLKLKSMEQESGGMVKKMVKEIQVKDNLINGIKAKLENIQLPENLTMFDLDELGIFTEEFLTFKKPLHAIFHLKGTAQKMIPFLKEENILDEPRCILGTVHSVKGGESDHVWFDTGTSSQCARAMVENVVAFNDEARVAYVAATRGRQTLGLLNAAGLRNPVLP